jgi:hypothetical protein
MQPDYLTSFLSAFAAKEKTGDFSPAFAQFRLGPT